MKIVHSILLSFAFILLLFGITTYINFRLSEVVIDNNEYLTHSSSIIRNSGRFQRNILTIFNGLRGYLLTGEKTFVESYEVANQENEAMLTELSATITDSAQSRLLREIKLLNDQWTAEYTEPLRQAKLLSSVSDSNLIAFNRMYKERFATGDELLIQKQLQQKFKEFTSSEYEIRNTRKEQLASSVRKTRAASFLLIIASIVTAVVVIIFLVRRISGRIRQMARMANNIAAGNYDVNVPNTGSDELSSLGLSLNEMAKKLSETISLLRSSNAELDQFAHVVSHDLKGPLRGISNVVSWIEEDHASDLSPKIVEYLNIIKGRVSRGENLINGLLAYARADRERIEKEVVDVGVLLAEVLDNLPREEIMVDIGPMPTIFTERLLLFQVFSNLISNSFKYNDKEEGSVRIYYKNHKDYFEFFIEDRGIGIDEKHHKRIFQIFQTLRARDSFESTGVGLAIVKKILDGKQQTINVSSKLGEGSIFSFTWPKQ